MGIKFVPAKSFEAEVNGSLNRYREGQVYTVHDTPAHTDLASKVKKWAEDGKVVIAGATSKPSRPVRIVTSKPERE